ncbi:MAG TPA: AMP-binding protein, partial [Gaiellaceae bacterium]|nr:AMP-binding protein [Gaiellaceae bacterium]
MATPSPAPAIRPEYTGKRTLPELWRFALAEAPGTPAYLEEHESGWVPVSWQEAGERVDVLAHALLANGVRRGDAVAVLAQTRLEWVLLDWAISAVGAVVVGLYPTNSARECAYILGHAEAVLAFAEDDEQRAKLEEVRDELPNLAGILGFGEFAALEEEGRARRSRHPDAVAEAAAAIGEDDLGTLIYTSGTTGPPKGC